MSDDQSKGPGQHPNSRANLQSFADHPERINKNGWPKNVPRISTALARLLRHPCGEDYPIKNKADEIAQSLYEKAKGGDVAAIGMVFDRIEGKVSQTLRLGPAELPTGELVERLVSAFAECGVDEQAARRVLLSLGSDDDNNG